MNDRASRPPLVLVADDDARSARVLARLLRADGYEVEVTLDGAATIGRLCRAPSPDVLVTDIRMPHASGLDAAHFGRSMNPKLSVVLVSAYYDDVPLGDRSFKRFDKPLDYNALAAELGRGRPNHGIVA